MQASDELGHAGLDALARKMLAAAEDKAQALGTAALRWRLTAGQWVYRS